MSQQRLWRWLSRTLDLFPGIVAAATSNTRQFLSAQ
jgi:hypothetical protein